MPTFKEKIAERILEIKKQFFELDITEATAKKAESLFEKFLFATTHEYADNSMILLLKIIISRVLIETAEEDKDEEEDDEGAAA